MLTVEQLLANRKTAEEDFVNYFKGSYTDIDNWIREYDKWYRHEAGQVEKIGFYKLLDCTFVTPSEAGAVEYNNLGKIKAVQIKTKLSKGRPVAECCEGIYDGPVFVAEGEAFDIPFERCFPIFVEMLEAFDNLQRAY